VIFEKVVDKWIFLVHRFDKESNDLLIFRENILANDGGRDIKQYTLFECF